MVTCGVASVSVYRTSRLEPRLLQAGRCRGPSLRLALEQQADKVSGRCAHALEVVLREAEVEATDVQTRLLQTLIQEGGCATQYNVVESFKNISEVESHLLLRQVAPAHDVVQETSLLCPENRNT
ncbi:hypothetical protein EYF80_009977 [Liparis tanakae]|uniref:Uncharacterized protein n=1 Tax=Liparis tanakae TaxID=230148 RepID=A0A4Z2IQE7_9TELE|nr:hypothetical protein EYF80_009977 [Liparis tanakae]